MLRILHRLTFLVACGLWVSGIYADNTSDDPYREVALGRAGKIVSGMESTAPVDNRDQVVQAIADQYVALHSLHDARDAAKQALKENLGEGLETTLESAVAAVENGIAQEVADLHIRYCAKLSSLLAPEQVNAVKDGMTYNVAPNTYRVYMEMLPDLTDDQRARIHAWLLEAREHAMDGGSSDEKHHWFGKYKGRINNYLSQLGYDLKQAEHDMFARKKAGKAGG